MAKVDEVANRLAGQTKVVEKLGFMFRGESSRRFEFDHETIEHNQVRNVALQQFATLVEGAEGLLGLKRNTAKAQFDLEAFLIYFFAEPISAVVVNFEGGTHGLVTLFLVDFRFHQRRSAQISVPFFCFSTHRPRRRGG